MRWKEISSAMNNFQNIIYLFIFVNYEFLVVKDGKFVQMFQLVLFVKDIELQGNYVNIAIS
jgi:hypothetical protein